MFANGLILVGVALLPGLLVHAEAESSAATTQDRAIPAFFKLLIFAAYLPLIYFASRVFPLLMGSPSLDFLWRRGQGTEFLGIWLGLALAVGTGMEIRVARKNERDDSERIHRVLAITLGLLSILVLGT